MCAGLFSKKLNIHFFWSGRIAWIRFIINAVYSCKSGLYHPNVPLFCRTVKELGKFIVIFLPTINFSINILHFEHLKLTNFFLHTFIILRNYDFILFLTNVLLEVLAVPLSVLAHCSCLKCSWNKLLVCNKQRLNSTIIILNALNIRIYSNRIIICINDYDGKFGSWQTLGWQLYLRFSASHLKLVVYPANLFPRLITCALSTSALIIKIFLSLGDRLAKLS